MGALNEHPDESQLEETRPGEHHSFTPQFAVTGQTSAASNLPGLDFK